MVVRRGLARSPRVRRGQPRGSRLALLGLVLTAPRPSKRAASPSLLTRVRRTIADRALPLPAGSGILVACSGGPDSVAMLDVLHRLAPDQGWRLAIASVDHGLRASAAADVALVEHLAGERGLSFHRLRVRIPRRDSIQAGAREARYQALRALARQEGLDRVAVGHTQDDQAETVLARLLRGSGVTGLAGIEPSRADGVVRPLLDATRAMVLAHLRRHRLPFVEDPSNVDLRFERARIRHVVVPMLLREDPRLFQHLADLADEARAIRDAADARTRRGLDADVPRAVVRDASPPERRALLVRWTSSVLGRAPGRAHLAALERLARDGRGEVLLPAGWVAVADAERLHLAHRDAVRTRSTTRAKPSKSQRLP